MVTSHLPPLKHLCKHILFNKNFSPNNISWSLVFGLLFQLFPSIIMKPPCYKTFHKHVKYTKYWYFKTAKIFKGTIIIFYLSILLKLNGHLRFCWFRTQNKASTCITYEALLIICHNVQCLFTINLMLDHLFLLPKWFTRFFAHYIITQDIPARKVETIQVIEKIIQHYNM